MFGRFRHPISQLHNSSNSILAMFTDAQSKELFERVLDRMVENGWLENYTFTSGKGFCLGWTVGGAEKAVCLKEIATVYGLTQNDQAPLLFDKLAHGQPVPD